MDFAHGRDHHTAATIVQALSPQIHRRGALESIFTCAVVLQPKIIHPIMRKKTARFRQ
jgi:hypothetical protein